MAAKEAKKRAKKKTKKTVVGNRAKYASWLTKEKLSLLKGWAMSGLTDVQIAKNIGISVATLYRWKNSHCEICEALARGKDVADYEVSNALHKAATGYWVEETKTTVNEKGDTVTTTYKRWVRPDVTATSIWLRNRQPEQWKDKPAPLEEADSIRKLDELIRGIDNAAKS